MKKTRPTKRQKEAVKKVLEEGKSISKAMLEVGYSPKTAKNPKNLTESKAFQDLMDTIGLDDETLGKKHKELLNSHRLDHMTFPLGPKEDDAELEDVEGEAEEELGLGERTKMSDGEIEEMLASVNCKVRKIVHGETARHVYFWSPDNKARKEALDMAYKIKGHYAPEKKHLSGGISLATLFDESEE
jgi:hypothetical protein